MQHFSVDISQSKFAALKLVGEGSVIDTELMEDRGLEIMDVYSILGHTVTILDAASPVRSRFDSATGHPHREDPAVMIAAVFFLGWFALAEGGSAKLSTPDHEGIIQ